MEPNAQDTAAPTRKPAAVGLTDNSLLAEVEHDEPGQPQEYAQPFATMRRLAPEIAESEREQRRHSHHHCRDTGADSPLHRQPHHAVPSKQQQHTHNASVAPLPACRQRMAAPPEPDQHQHAGAQVADARRQQGRHGLDGEAHGEISGTPDEVHAEQGKKDRGSQPH
jgi:hypothetical protein